LIDFLKYILNPENYWTCCIGVLYGTDIWPLADSSEIHGCFKMSLTRAKRSYLSNKKEGKDSFILLDVIPILNRAWEASISRPETNRRAVISRGFSVLNYILLLDERLKRTNKGRLGLIAASKEGVDCNDNTMTHHASDATPNNENGDATTVFGTINNNGVLFQSCLDKLISEEVKAAENENGKNNKQKKQHMHRV
jgi:hypothetical protein